MTTTHRRLRQKLLDRQRYLCVACGHFLGDIDDDDLAVHEVIIKRGDLPGDKRVFHEYNCVAAHNQNPLCDMPHLFHGNTKKYDELCISYLVSHYGVEPIAEWIEGLGMKAISSRVRRVYG